MLRAKPVTNEFYHIFNRGVDKRTTFENKYDIVRFLMCLKLFNTIEPTVSIFNSGVFIPDKDIFRSRKKYDLLSNNSASPLIRLVAYHLLPNHYHLILQQLCEGGISEFQKRIGGGYTNYFNDKQDRTGPLFSGKYKIVHIQTDEQFKYLFAYVSCNDVVHNTSFPFPLSEGITQLVSSRNQYEQNSPGLCDITQTSHFVADKIFWREALSLAKEIKEIRDLDKMTLE